LESLGDEENIVALKDLGQPLDMSISGSNTTGRKLKDIGTKYSTIVQELNIKADDGKAL